MVNLARPNPALHPTGECTGHAAMSLMFAYALQQGRYSSDRVTGLTDRLLEIAETLNNSFLAAKALVALAVLQIVAEAGAPEFIHYISLTIEGGELEALKGLDFSKYKVGAFTIEHNYEEPKRTQIRHFLEANDYGLERRRLNEDWYVLHDAFSSRTL